MCNTKRLITEETEKKFVKTIIEFASDNKMTVSNIMEAMSQVIQYMNDNAVIEKEVGEKIPISSVGEDAVQSLPYPHAHKMIPKEIADFAKEIYGMCVDRKLTYRDYSLLVFKLNLVKDDIVRMNTAENNRKLLHEI